MGGRSRGDGEIAGALRVRLFAAFKNVDRSRLENGSRCSVRAGSFGTRFRCVPVPKFPPKSPARDACPLPSKTHFAGGTPRKIDTIFAIVFFFFVCRKRKSLLGTSIFFKLSQQFEIGLFSSILFANFSVGS